MLDDALSTTQRLEVCWVSVIRDHMIKNKRRFDFENFTMLDKEENGEKRLTSEMSCKHLQSNSGNKKEDTRNSQPVHSVILNKLKDKKYHKSFQI